MGSKTTEQALASVQLLASVLNTWLPWFVSVHEFVVTLRMASFAAGGSIDLAGVSAEHGCEWNEDNSCVGLKIHETVAKRDVCHIVYPNGIVNAVGVGPDADHPRQVQEYGRAMLKPYTR